VLVVRTKTYISLLARDAFCLNLVRGTGIRKVELKYLKKEVHLTGATNLRRINIGYVVIIDSFRLRIIWELFNRILSKEMLRT